MSWFKQLFGTKVVQQHNIVSGGSVVAGDYVVGKYNGGVAMELKMKGGSVIINGKTYSGGSIQINGNSVIVDGVVQQGDPLAGPITVTVTGDVETIRTVSGDVFIDNGSVGNVQTTSGDVTVNGNVQGNIQTVSGDVKGHKLEGNAKTVSGDIKTLGIK